MKKKTKRILTTIVLIPVILGSVWCGGRYGWKLLGFKTCTGSGIESVTVNDGSVTVKGFYPGSFPHGYIGCVSKEEDGNLYIGVKYSNLFGIFETGQFEETFKTEGEIKKVYLKAGDNEYLIYPDELTNLIEYNN